MTLTRWERWVLIGLAVVFTVITGLTSLWGMAFFFVPLGLIALVLWGAYFALTRVQARNPIHPASGMARSRFADGQPLGRSEMNRLEREAWAAREAESEREEIARRERENLEAENDPRDTGAPPHVPFP